MGLRLPERDPGALPAGLRRRRDLFRQPGRHGPRPGCEDRVPALGLPGRRRGPDPLGEHIFRDPVAGERYALPPFRRTDHVGYYEFEMLLGEDVGNPHRHTELFAVNADSGKEIWSTHLVDDHGSKKPHYGFTTSPLMAEGVLVVEIGAEDGKSGLEAW